MKGFNRAGIYRMKQFYETYKDNEIVSTLLRQLSWSNNVIILSSTHSMEEKEFYIRMCIKNNYSARELNRQIESGYFHRYMLSDGKANQSLTKATGEEDYPNTRILDTYSLEFLDLPNNYSEKDLKKAIISNMNDFILEIGKDFTFVGEEYRVQVGGQDFFIDLLCVGIILCSGKNEQVVEYAMSRTMSPTMVSQYTLKLIDKKLLENKLKEISDMVEENNNKK